MKSIIAPSGTFGGFVNVDVLEDRYIADGVVYQFDVIGEPHSIGEWDGSQAIPEVPQSSQAGTQTEWLIDIGTFFDRFGSAKLAVLSCPDATVQAILRDVQARKWIDLKRPDVAQSLGYIATKVSGITPELISSVLNNPVTDAENFALRKLYFN